MITIISILPALFFLKTRMNKTPTLLQERLDQPAQVMCTAGGPDLILGGRQALRAVSLVVATEDGNLRRDNARVPPPHLEDSTPSTLRRRLTFLPIRTAVLKSNLSTTALASHPFNPNLSLAAASNGELTIWNFRVLNYASVLQRWQAHERTITAMAFLEPFSSGSGLNPSMTSFASLGDLSTGLSNPLIRPSSAPAPSLSSIGHLITSSADGEVKLWSLGAARGGFFDSAWPRGPNDCEVIRKGSSGTRDIACAGTTVLVAGEDGAMERWRIDSSLGTAGLIQRWQASTQSMNSVRINPGDVRLAASGGRDGAVKIWDERNDGVASFRTHSSIWAVRWRPDGSFIATCPSVLDPCVYVWDLRSTHTPAYVFRSHREAVTDFMWADNCHVISCAKDGEVHAGGLYAAEIPIEKMRTVNIAFSMRRSDLGSQPDPMPIHDPPCHVLTSIVAKVDRSLFERNHPDLDLETIKSAGFPLQQGMRLTAALAPAPSRPVTKFAKEMKVVGFVKDREIAVLSSCTYQLVELIWAAYRGEFADSVRDPKMVGVSCFPSSSVSNNLASLKSAMLAVPASPAQLQTVEALEWMWTDGQSWLTQTLEESIRQFQLLGDVFMCIVIASLQVADLRRQREPQGTMKSKEDALETATPDIAQEALDARIIKWCKSYIGLLRRLQHNSLAGNMIRRSPLLQVSALSQHSTEFEVKGDSPVCYLCGRQVKGLWSNCDKCGQGGHLAHMKIHRCESTDMKIADPIDEFDGTS